MPSIANSTCRQFERRQWRLCVRYLPFHSKWQCEFDSIFLIVAVIDIRLRFQRGLHGVSVEHRCAPISSSRCHVDRILNQTEIHRCRIVSYLNVKELYKHTS